MAKVLITKALQKEIAKTFSLTEAHKILDQLESLGQQPKKGKFIGTIDTISIKELKYKKYRFYCVMDGHKAGFGTQEELENLLIKFVRMSEKKDQQQVIDEIKRILQDIGF